MTEPSSNEDYGRVEYWDARYTTEEQYDWFASVYPACVEAVLAELRAVAGRRGRGSVLRVLHLGTGNSALCADLAREWAAVEADTGVGLAQVAVDYSAVVIERMRAKHVGLAGVRWAVADIRDLAAVRAEQRGVPFDVVIDKGTMDALQTGGGADSDGDIAAMLQEVSRCLDGADGEYRAFVQITWEVPYMRLALTQGGQYAWGNCVRHRYLGDSDMYRIFVYGVNSAPGDGSS